LTVLSGPSGVGKGTVIAAVRRRRVPVWVSVSATTRLPRPGETDGVEYRFVDRTEFCRMVDAHEMLEHAEYAGNLYGTPRGPVLEKLNDGIPVLLELDVQGARQVRASMPDAQLIFLAPPSMDELVRRLTGRHTEDGRVRAERLALAEEEMAAAGEFDAEVINNDVEQAADELLALMSNNPICRGAQ